MSYTKSLPQGLLYVCTMAGFKKYCPETLWNLIWHTRLSSHLNYTILISIFHQICLKINGFIIWMISDKTRFGCFYRSAARCTSLLLRKVAALGPGDLVKAPLIMKQFLCVFRHKKHLPKYDYRVLIRTLISIEKKI